MNASNGLLEEKLLALNEFDLTNSVLIPLLKSFGFERVEYFGGPSEEGKDIVCWRHDEIDQLELAVAQVKRYKPSRRAADRKSFSEIVTQLSQASEKRLPYIDGSEHLPGIIYFITPHPVDTAVLTSRLEGFQLLRSRRIKIIDGPRLRKLLTKHVPGLVDRLLGKRKYYAEAIVSQLTNEILLRALQAPERRGVETFYTDIDISPGQQPLKSLLHSHLHPEATEHKVPRARWRHIVAVVRSLDEKHRCQILDSSLEQIEEEFKERLPEYQSWKDAHEKLLERLNTARNELNNAGDEIARAEATLRETKPELFQRYSDMTTVIDQIKTLETLRVALTQPGSQKKDQKTGELQELEKNLLGVEKLLQPLITALEVSETRELSLKERVAKSADRKPELYYEATFEPTSLAEIIRRKRKRILNTIPDFNIEQPDQESLRDFLELCGETFEFFTRLESTPEIYSSLKPETLRESLTEEARLKLAVTEIFDTKLNFALIGEAGAGKSTTLQMYAHTKLQSSDKRLILFAPLSHAVRSWKNLKTGEVNPEMEHFLSAYLSALEIDIDILDLRNEFESNGALLLLDGVDEVVHDAPHILSAISRLAEAYPRVQIIVSSRTSGSEVLATSFLCLRLLPFSDHQRDAFIRNWFGKELPRKAHSVIHHLREATEVAETVRNPLLATIFCVLAQHNVPLPDSEVRLYEERLNLLLGYYDIHKQISRIHTHSSQLALIAQKLAFRFHDWSIRTADKAIIQKYLFEQFHDQMPRDALSIALNELVDPCNILVPVTGDGKLGFGHLRYQEYLVARELVRNRGVNFLPLLKDEWWSGPLLLFSQMTASLGWLLRTASFHGELESCRGILSRMIDVGPVGQRDGLRVVLGGVKIR